MSLCDLDNSNYPPASYCMSVFGAVPSQSINVHVRPILAFRTRHYGRRRSRCLWKSQSSNVDPQRSPILLCMFPQTRKGEETR